MKRGIVIFVCWFAIINAKFIPKTKDIVDSIVGECYAESKVTVDELQIDDLADIKDTENARKFVLCFYKRMDMFSDETGFSRENMLQQMLQYSTESAANALLDKCVDGNKQASSSSDYAFRVFKCIGASMKAEFESGKHE